MATSKITRACAWVKDDPLGMEYADLVINGTTLHAVAVAVGSDPVPYRLDFELATGDDFVTSRLTATTRGDGWMRRLDLERLADGTWKGTRDGEGDLPATEAGCAPGELARDVADVDVQYSPLTNLMPTRRIGLDSVGTSRELTMAWIAVPYLEIYPDGQRYTIVKHDPDAGHLVKYESLDGEFVAMLTCDNDALVRDYPGIARRFG